jgi:redox-sensitive bicupin YhaK (pirin superfamily)
MENIKTLDLALSPPPPHMVGDGFRVHNYIPSMVGMQRMNPFIMLDYNSPHYFPPSHIPPGVGVHPHRGFETVTIAYQGKVSHHDSGGNSGTIGEGEVQWMTAASGVLHKEYHEKEFAAQGGVFQMVQLWVNLPAANKMDPPSYQAITRDQITEVNLPDDAGVVKIIAGTFQGHQGPAKTHTRVDLFNLYLNANKTTELNFPQHDHTAMVVIKGSVKVNGHEILKGNDLGVFSDSGENIHIEALEESIVLMLNGEPIMEPIAAYGPFVMNTREEIIQAYQDFQMGKFGQLED